jgi:FkbH-like protein
VLFELDKYDRRLHRLAPATPERAYEYARNIQKMSLLYWAEHCVECAAPACYQSCDLYEPRLDTKCRRFTFGAFENRNFRSADDYGVEISFKKWAKMEAYGNLRLSSPRSVRWAKRIATSVAPIANVSGKLLARLTKNVRWKAVSHEGLEALVRWLDRNRQPDSQPDAFLLEVYNPTEEAVRLQLKFAVQPSTPNALIQLSRAFATTVECGPGYSRNEIDFSLLPATNGDFPFLISMMPEADDSARLVFLNAGFVKFSGRSAKPEGKNIKCVVFDLDNTLWKGVLVEGDDVVVRAETISLLKHLDERGILLSVASKNDHSLAWKKLEALGLSEYFLFPQINWNPKSQSVQTIARRLNFGLDTFAFVDDNPFELDEVGRVLPEVLRLNAIEIASLFSDARFQGSATPDSRRRRQLYREAAAREVAQESFGGDDLGFLASCQINLEITRYSPQESERVAELVQRTNQLNFSGCKYTRDQLQEILSNPRLDKFVLKRSDRYGSYGTVGFCIVERTSEAIRVHDLMLSCRVQGKLLERAFFAHLIEHHNPEGAGELCVNFRPTARNKPAQQVLESLGFRQSDVAFNGCTPGMNCSSFESLRCDIIRVRCSTALDQPGMAMTLNPEIGELNHERL